MIQEVETTMRPDDEEDEFYDEEDPEEPEQTEKKKKKSKNGKPIESFTDLKSGRLCSSRKPRYWCI